MPGPSAPLTCLILGTPGDVRVDGFQDALAGAGHPPAEVVSYPAWLAAPAADKARRLAAADRVRIESPGRDPAALRAICQQHRGSINPSDPPSRDAIHEPSIFGECVREVMHEIRTLADRPAPVVFLNAPCEIAEACDKVRTLERLGKQLLPVPRTLDVMQGPGVGYDRVREAMASAGTGRVFIKLRHGFSGSGVVAYQASPTRELAITTVQMQEGAAGIVLRNTRRIRRYAQHDQIRALLDTLCPKGVYVEPWVPKAGIANRTTDLRVVTVAGRARHIVLRLSRNPITNLHLLNERSGPEPLKERMRPADWDAVMETCERVARCFPRMLYLGIDVAVHADLRGHTVFEVNAFGDLLHGVTDRGQTTYQAQVQAMAHWSGRLD